MPDAISCICLTDCGVIAILGGCYLSVSGSTLSPRCNECVGRELIPKQFQIESGSFFSHSEFKIILRKDAVPQNVP